jgi:hypothetical protein
MCKVIALPSQAFSITGERDPLRSVRLIALRKNSRGAANFFFLPAGNFSKENLVV